MDFYEFLAADSLDLLLNTVGYHINYSTALRDISREYCVTVLKAGDIEPNEQRDYYAKIANAIGLPALVKYERIWKKIHGYEDEISRYSLYNGARTPDWLLFRLVEYIIHERQKTNALSPKISVDVLGRMVRITDYLHMIAAFNKGDSWDTKYYNIMDKKIFGEDYESDLNNIDNNDDFDVNTESSIIYGCIEALVMYDRVHELISCLTKQDIKDIYECSNSEILDSYATSLKGKDLIPEYLMVIINDNHTPCYSYSHHFEFFRDLISEVTGDDELRAISSILRTCSYTFGSEADRQSMNELYNAVGHHMYVRMFHFYNRVIFGNEQAARVYLQALWHLYNNDTYMSAIDEYFRNVIKNLYRYSPRQTEVQHKYEDIVFYRNARCILDDYYTPANVETTINCLKNMGLEDAVTVFLPQCCINMFE